MKTIINCQVENIEDIVKQLVYIYEHYENWHVFKMPYPQALRYHEKRVKSGDIQVYVEDGEVLGYGERHFINNVCFLDNAWIKPTARRGKVFKALYKQFFNTLPDNITHIIGHRNDENRKCKTEIVKISKWRFSHGRH